MLGILYALTTVLAWGTWLAPSQNVALKNQQIKTFYVACANLALAFAISLWKGLDQLSLSLFWPPFIGGIVWSLSGLCAFTAAKNIGMAKAFGIWAPLNIIVGLICGRLLFHEFEHPSASTLALLLGSVAIIIGGVLMIIFARGGTGETGKGALIGYAGALGAGILWGIYFIPIKLSGVSMWIAALPMAVGIFVGSTLLTLLGGQSPKLDKRGDYLRLGATGILWTIGNYGMLLLVDTMGAGKGYTIAQLSVVVNALVGIYGLKDPRPGTRAATLTLAGCVLATIGGILLNSIN
jgi:glucose uptake protein